MNILIDGINDTKECCIELINLLRGMNCYVNLIPMNETNTMFRRSSEKATDEFYDLLMQKGLMLPVVIKVMISMPLAGSE